MAENVILITPQNLTNQTTAISDFSQNNSTITSAFVDVLSRSGIAPNQMQTFLDMNNNRIINLPPPGGLTDPVRLKDVTTPTQISVLQNSLTTTTLSSAAHTFTNTDCFTFIHRSNSGNVMIDVLPSTALNPNCVIYIQNSDVSAIYGLRAAGSTKLNGTTNGYLLLGPNQTAAIYSDGSNYTTLQAPERAKLAPATTLTLYWANTLTTSCNDGNMAISSATPWCSAQQCWNYVQANIDLGNPEGGDGVICQMLDSGLPYTAFTTQGGTTATISAAGEIPGQNTLIGMTFQGNCVTPANTILQSPGAIIVADDFAQVAITCFQVQTSNPGSPLFTSQHDSFLELVGPITVVGGVFTGNIIQAINGGAIITFGTLSIQNGSANSLAIAQNHSRVEVGGTINLTNNTNFAGGFYAAVNSSYLQAAAIYTGTTPNAGSVKYFVSGLSVINTSGSCSGVPGTTINVVDSSLCI